MATLVGINYLINKLNTKKNYVKKRYDYYNQTYRVFDLQVSRPKKFRGIQTRLGWCSRAVDCIADRLIFNGFDNDNFNITEIFNMNNPDTLFDSAILSSLISSCSFAYISEDVDGYPSIQILDGSRATGIIDEKTGLLKEGYAILDVDDQGRTITDAYFTPEYTLYRQNGVSTTYDNPTGYCLLVPIIYRPSDTRPFGHSRISNACMELIQGASRTIDRSEVGAEYGSYPQRYLIGIDPDTEKPDQAKASVSSMFTIFKNDDGTNPTIGQFSQLSLQPHLEQFQMYVKAFCGETGLTADDLGFVSDNPSSAESIKASHDTLRLIVRKAQATYGRCFLNIGMVSACLRDKTNYKRREFYKTVPTWAPIFEPDSAMLSSIGDGVLKINQAIPNYFNIKALETLTGIKGNTEETQSNVDLSEFGFDEVE